MLLVLLWADIKYLSKASCIDEEYPWANRVGELQDTKYAYVVHAELNAILNATTPLKGCSLYVTLYPCNECVKSIIQSGIAEIIFEDNSGREGSGRGIITIPKDVVLFVPDESIIP